MDTDERLKVTAELQARLADFWHEVDTNWGRSAAEYFTEDGVFEASERAYRGREMIDRFYRFRQDRGPRVAAHTVANFRAVPTGPGEAVCTWYLLLHAADGEPVLPAGPPILLALATDHCVKGEDGCWRYRHRRFETWFKGGVPTTTMTAELEAQQYGVD